MRNKKALVITNPDMVAPVMSFGDGVIGRIMGEVLITIECKKIDVKLRPVEECTSELPVIYNNEPRYVMPVTRILLEPNVKPTMVENCTFSMSPMFKINDKNWIRLPKREKVPTPETLSLINLQKNQKFEPLTGIPQGGIYTEQNLEDYRRMVMFPQQRQRIITELTRKVMWDGEGSPQWENLMGKDYLKKVTRNIMERMWGKF